MKNNEKILLSMACFFGGVVAGFLIAPIKRGGCCGNNSGNNVWAKEELKEVIDREINEVQK